MDRICEACGTECAPSELSVMVTVCLSCSFKPIVADAMLGRQIRIGFAKPETVQLSEVSDFNQPMRAVAIF